MLSLRHLVAAATLLLPPAAAHAAASDWYHVEGGSVRVVTSGMPDETGTLRGALEIRLKPGWKTYWRDPGSSGVPPSLNLAVGDDTALVEIGFPAPQRFDDGYAEWAGYDEPVTLALSLHLPSGAKAPARVQASAFLGVCETICVPVQADLTVDPYGDPDNPQHALVVSSAFAALPGPARGDFGARATGVEDGAIVVETALPDGVEAVDIFVAGTDNLMLGSPERMAQRPGPVRFRIPVLHGADATGGAEVAYTLVTSAGAVAGSLRLP